MWLKRWCQYYSFPANVRTIATAMNHFSGNVLDRCSENRSDAKWLSDALLNEQTKFVLFKRSNPLAQYAETQCMLCTFSRSQVKDILDEIEEKNDASSPWPRSLLYLGQERISDRKHWFSIEVNNVNHENLVADGQFFTKDRRDIFEFSRSDASIFAQSRSMLEWLDKYKHCAMCGGKMHVEEGGYKQVCENQNCVSNKGVHNTCYPRTDVVVIMRVMSQCGTQVLLGRKPIFPRNMYSCLAGFVEPGESLEDAVVRETKEESGVDVTNIKYVSSQPWPYPSSLMIGCTATATSHSITIDESEMADVMWFDRSDLEKTLAGDTAKLDIPPKQAIAHQLLSRWIVGSEEKCKL